MMVSGTITSVMDTVSTQTKKEPGTKATGRMTLNLGKELKFGQKEVNMLVNMKMVRSKDMELTLGQMGLFTKVTG